MNLLCRLFFPFVGRHPDDVAAHARTHALIDQLLREIRTMSDTFQAEWAKIQADVAGQTTVVSSVTAALTGLTQQVASLEAAAAGAGANTVPLADLVAFRQALEANTSSLAAAVPQNTPAAAAPTDSATTGSVPTGTAPAGTEVPAQPDA